MKTKNKFPFQVIIYTSKGDDKFISSSYSTDKFTAEEEAQTVKRMQEESGIFAEIYFDSRDDESYSELYGTIDLD